MAYVDCDSHILPDDAFDDVAAEFERQKPRIVTDTEGNSFVVYEARQKNIPDYARHIPNPFMPRPRSAGDDPEDRIADMAKARIDMQVLVPIIVHPVNTGPMAGGWRLTRHYATRGYGFWSALGNAIENSLALANLMFGGVLDAFPKLRFCFMEGGGTQVPHLMESLAAVYEGEGDYDKLGSKPKRAPVEYLDRLYFSVRTTESLLGVLVDRFGYRSWVI